MKTSTKQYLSYLFIGLGCYITWFCIIAQTNYWRHFYGASFLTMINMVYCVAEFSSAVAVIWLEKICGTRIFAIIHFIVSAGSLISLVPLRVIENITARTVITLIPVALCGFNATMYFPAIVASSSNISPIMSQALTFGVGASNIGIQLVEDVIFWIIPQKQGEEYEQFLVLNAIVYYSICVVIMVMCISSYTYLECKFPAAIIRRHRKSPVLTHQAEALVVSDVVEPAVVKDELKPNLQQDVKISQNSDLPVETEPKNAVPSTCQRKKRSITSRIAAISISYAFNWGINVILFPLFITAIPSSKCYEERNEPFSDGWNLYVLTIFNGADFVGRLIPLIKRVQKAFSPKRIIFCVYLRLSFIVYFSLATLPYATETRRPIIIIDWLSSIVVIAFGFSFSFLMTLTYIKYQELLDTEAEINRGSFIMNLIMEVGIFVSGVASYFMIPIFQ